MGEAGEHRLGGHEVYPVLELEHPLYKEEAQLEALQEEGVRQAREGQYESASRIDILGGIGRPSLATS